MTLTVIHQIPRYFKVFGTVISDQLHLLLERSGLLSDSQSGFLSCRSKGDFMGLVSHSWLFSLANYGETCGLTQHF